MPINLTAGSGTPIPLGTLKDLQNNALTELNLGNEFVQYLGGPISALPDTLLTTSIQYTSGNQKWTLGTAAPVSFTLSGGVTGKITVIKSGTILSYTDSFPTQVALSLSTTTNSSTSKPISGPDGSVYICVELDLSIQAGVSISYQPGIYGISGSASTSDTFQMAFYKNCQPGDNLGQSIAIAIGDLVLPFHANTLSGLKPNDFLKHTANANLQLGLGANIGFSKFSFADQWQSGIPGVAGSPTLKLGVNPTAQPTVKLAYSFAYAATFEQLLWVDAMQHAHLHLYRSDKQTQSLNLTAGITADANATATTTVQSQITGAPANAAPGSPVASALGTVFQNFSSETGKLSSEIDSKITTLLKPLNQTVQVSLDVSIASTNQKFQLLDYTIDLTNPAYAAAWNSMTNGRYLDAIENSNGSVQLDPGSGLEQLYGKTASISLNFFGQWVGSWSTTQIANSSLIYAGNNIFHLITVAGLQQVSKINKTSTEVDVYFAAEMDLSAAAPTLHPPNLNMILRASNNKQFGLYIANFVSLLNQGQDATALTNQIVSLANSPNTTQVLQIVFNPSAYGNLTYSPNPPVAGNDAADRANYAAFASAGANLMPSSTPSQFVYAGRNLTYDIWANWNIAGTDNWPAPAGALPDRKQTGAGGGQVQAYLDSVFGANTNALMVGYPLQAASEFMDLCQDLATLANQPVDATTWNSFVNSLIAIINRDMNLDFVAPAALALTTLCSNSNGAPQQTVGPAQGLAGNLSVAVTMTVA
jgi:hypothetical protein